MLILLVVPDGERRRGLAEAARSLAPDWRCVESADGIDASFALMPEQLGVVVIDAAVALQRGPAWLTHWRRMSPHGTVSVLPAAEGGATPAARAEADRAWFERLLAERLQPRAGRTALLGRKATQSPGSVSR